MCLKYTLTIEVIVVDITLACLQCAINLPWLYKVIDTENAFGCFYTVVVYSVSCFCLDSAPVIYSVPRLSLDSAEVIDSDDVFGCLYFPSESPLGGDQLII